MKWCNTIAFGNFPFFSPKLKRALSKQSQWVNGRLHQVQPYYTLCAQTAHLSLQVLSRKRVEASLSGHSYREALRSLATSQESQYGSRHL